VKADNAALPTRWVGESLVISSGAGFQRLELVEQPVVLGVRNARLVEDVVAVVVLIQFSAQL
jgi:hypothetical protein